MSEKETNPKDAAAFDRAPLHLLPLAPLLQMSLAFLEGGAKYGFWNYTVAGVRAAVYAAAAARHLFKWFFGQDCDPETGVHHLGYVMACCAVVIEADSRGILRDDRPPRHPNVDGLFEQASATAKRILDLYGSRNPRHYTVTDTIKGTDK